MHWLLPDDPAARQRRDRTLLGLFLVAALLLVARAARKQDGVLVRNQEWGARFVARQDPYADPAGGPRLHGPYPPSYALVCAPLSRLPEQPARVAWALAQVGALAASYVLLRRWLARGWPTVAPHAPIAFAVGLVLAGRYLLRDTAGGGGNLLYATAVLWGLELVFAGRAVAGALLLALPLALKPNFAPLLLVLPLRGRTSAGVLACAALLLCAAAPAVWFGSEPWVALWRRWLVDVLAYGSVVDLARADLVPDGFPVDVDGMNQSLRAALGRVAPGTWGLWVARAGGLAALAAAAWATLRGRNGRGAWFGALAFLPAALLASPITWKAHHAALLVPFALLAAEALERRRARPLWAFLAAYWLSCGLLSEELIGKAWKQALQSASVVTWATLALLVVSCVLASRPAPPVRADAGYPRDEP
ncbi:MAG: DUF2029 domain-containing protein [Planctomycetes bacterium]|nr:DUF2029 domain-containing protein [Planctomycetota bacterium]